MSDPKEVFLKCLESPAPFADADEKAACQEMVDTLEEDLVQLAACTSYAFWYLSQNPETCPDPSVRNAMALREARRHLAYMNGDYEKALDNFKESLDYRKEHKLDLLKACFKSPFPIDENDKQKSEQMASSVREDLNRQVCIMRGQDKGKRAIMIKYARLLPGTEEDSYILAQIYMAERSVATTEFATLGTEERTFSVFDYNGFESSKAPAVATQVRAATLLQMLYPERLQTLVIMEPPFWFRGVLTVLRSVISGEIMGRIKMASGNEEKEEVFKELLNPEQAPTLLLPAGHLTGGVSLEHTLEDLPFYSLYDDVKCEREIVEPPPPSATDEAEQSSIVGTASSLLKSFW